MTLYEFNLLPQSERELVIFEQSKFLHDKIKKGFKYALYAKDMFFIEVICYEENLQVKEVNSFKSGYLLDKYAKYLRKSQ